MKYTKGPSDFRIFGFFGFIGIFAEYEHKLLISTKIRTCLCLGDGRVLRHGGKVSSEQSASISIFFPHGFVCEV